MSTTSLDWYVRRLRRMSPAEVASRAQDVLRRRNWAARQVRLGAPVDLPADALPQRSFGSPLPPEVQDRVPVAAATELLRAAEDVLAGRWRVLGQTRPDSADPDWFADPVTGRRAPQQELAFRVRHRDESVTGNVKQVWEMSRHHQITVLAAAWWLSEDPRFAEAAARQLNSWWRANPFLSGVHWTSGIESGVRLIAWVWARRLLASWPGVGELFERNPLAVAQIAWHQEFLAGFRSSGSSANNHLVAEAAGRLAGACAFPWYGRSDDWRRDAAAALETSLADNTFPDGLNRELATDYHRFVLELALTAAVEADAAGTPLSQNTWSLVARSLDAGVALLDAAGRPPRQGDGDEGRGLVLDADELDPWAVALGSGAAVLGPAEWWPRLAGSVQAIVLGALAGRHEVPRAASRPAEFPDAGLVLLRSDPQDGPEIWCRCDGGPHGFLSIAAHAHADALSLEVRHDGVELLVDPGTYCYHGEPQWRSWFRSTAAHNTVQLGGVDSSESGGPFMWTRHARTTVLGRDLSGPVRSWTAEHDGYRRLATPAVHRRTVTLDSPARALTVLDSISADGPVDVRLTWHLGPAVSVRLDDHVATLSWPVDGEDDGDVGAGERRQAWLKLPAALRWSVHRGETEPAQGWFSPAFGNRVPSVTLVGTVQASAGTTFCTTLSWRPEGSGTPEGGISGGSPAVT